MNILESIFNEQFIYAFGWTLVHSLWQGAIIGIIVAVAVVFLHKYSARLRYFIYSTSLIVVAGLAIVTFISSYTSYSITDEQKEIMLPANTSVINTVLTELSESSAASGPMNDILRKTASYCSKNISLFVMIWLMGMLVFMLRFVGGYSLVRRYKSHRVKAVHGEWERRFEDLSQRIALKKKVRLLESALVKVPMAIGYFKPVVLLPLGMINGVSTAQLEAILVHELAHIHRRDYLINILQSLMEAIFFYHPVVWWLSKNIRIEREHICDDIAIKLTGNTMEFAKALTNIQERRLPAPGLAAGLGGSRRNRLVSRIRRITGKPRIQSGYAEGFIAASILVISMIGLSAAAMITYPVENPLESVLGFEDTKSEFPVLSGINAEDPPAKEIMIEVIHKNHNTRLLPDSSEEEKARVRAYKKQYKLFQADSIMLAEEVLLELNEMEAELAQVEAEMAALEVKAGYLEELAEYQSYVVQSRDALERAKAMETYKEAMKDIPFMISRNSEGIVPCIYFFPDSTMFRRDSATWSFYMPEEFIFHDDSLSDFYVDTWTDQFVDMEEFQLQLAEQNLILAEEMKMLAAHQSLEEMEALEEIEYAFDGLDASFDALNYEFGEMSQSIHIVQEELYADGLIDHSRDYILVIDDKHMFINGEKQSRADFKKYRRLVDSLEGLDAIEDEEGLKIQIKH